MNKVYRSPPSHGDMASAVKGRVTFFHSRFKMYRVSVSEAWCHQVNQGNDY